MSNYSKIRDQIPEPKAIQEMVVYAGEAESLLLRCRSFIAAYADDLHNLGIHPDDYNRLIDDADELIGD